MQYIYTLLTPVVSSYQLWCEAVLIATARALTLSNTLVSSHTVAPGVCMWRYMYEWHSGAVGVHEWHVLVQQTFIQGSVLSETAFFENGINVIQPDNTAYVSTSYSSRLQGIIQIVVTLIYLYTVSTGQVKV